jgi:hypothetical protein
VGGESALDAFGGFWMNKGPTHAPWVLAYADIDRKVGVERIFVTSRGRSSDVADLTACNACADLSDPSHHHYKVCASTGSYTGIQQRCKRDRRQLLYCT